MAYRRVSHRSDRLSVIATSVPRFVRFDLLAQQLQSEPLLLRCRQPVAGHRERLCCRTEPCPITRIQIRIGQDRSQLGNLRLQCSDPGREQLERPLVIEIHAASRSGR